MTQLSENDITYLSQIFTAIGLPDPHKRQAGEQELFKMSKNQNYPLQLLLYILSNHQSIRDEERIGAASSFRKWVKEDWTKPSLSDVEFSEMHIEIKNSIVRVYMESRHNIVSKLLLEAILDIAKWEYESRWKGLTTDLMGFLNPDNLLDNNNFKAFKVLSKITKKYEYETQTDALSLEILHTSDTTVDYLLHFGKEILSNILGDNPPTDGDVLLKTLQLLKIILKCLYYIVCIDIPPKIDDDIESFKKIIALTLQLSYENEELKKMAFRCKGESLRAIILFSTKYRDDIEELIQGFSQEIFNACSQLKDDDTSNKFIYNAMKYFKNLIYWRELEGFFRESVKDLLSNIVFKIEKPDKDDVERFETESEQFVESYFNNASGTQKRNICRELCKAFARNFPKEIVPVLQEFISGYVDDFKADKGSQIGEITIINTLIDLGVKGFTARHGVTDSYIPTEFYTYFFDAVVEPTMNSLFEANEKNQDFNVDDLNLFHISMHIRFIFYFRNYLDYGKLLNISKNLSYLFKTKDETLHRILYITVENIFNMKADPDPFKQSDPVFNSKNSYPQIQFILQNIYSDLEKAPLIDAYQIKALLQTMNVMSGTCSDFIDAFTFMFKDMIKKLFKAYDFTAIYLTFDALSQLMIFVKDNNQSIALIVKELFPLLNQIIEENHQDLISYSFQIYALAIHFYNIEDNSPKVIFQSLLEPKNWSKEMMPLFPAYTMFLEEFIAKDVGVLGEATKNFQEILAKLLQMEADATFFSMANQIILQAEFDAVKQSGLLGTMLKAILEALFECNKNQQNKENNNKSVIRPSLAKGTIILFSLCLAKYGYENFFTEVVEAFGQQNQDIFFNFFISEQQIIRHYQKQPERRVMINGLVSMIYAQNYDFIPKDCWNTLLNAIIENIYRRKKHKYSLSDMEDKALTTGYSSNFAKLSWFKNQKTKYFDLPDEEKRFIEGFKENFKEVAGELLEKCVEKNLQQPFQQLFKD